MKNFISHLSLILALHTVSANAHATNRCEDLFSPTSTAKTQNKSLTLTNESWEQFYKKSDLNPRPALWLKIRQSLEKHVTHLQNPLETAGTDANRIGAVYKSMVLELPLLKTLIEADRLPKLSHADFITLKRLAANLIISVSGKPNSALQVFASLEALKYISSIESRVEFPRTKEEIEKETKKQEIDKKKQEKKDKDQPEDDEPPKWNKAEDKYKPENKDISSEDGGKKKNADILMTDADVPKRLLRQKIYDLFDLKDWSSNPVQRNALVKENSFTKKMIIDSLGESEVDVPVPYGYTLVPGKYTGYEIKEIGPGEFKLYPSSKEKVTLGLSRIIDEQHNSSLRRPVGVDVLAHWPMHLITFTESLKGLSAVEAALRMEKYISLDGGFLYYSKGDKIDEAELSKIDQKMNSLLTQMPKPMAMANAGAFNCDGAAWIGAILLRDVLGHQVRIAGGRTSAGIKTIENNKFHVVRSSDPAHAWLEVYDGKNWKPFDMTPKNNTPDSDSVPTDLQRDEPQESPPKDSKPDQQKGEQKSKSDSKDKGTDEKEAGESKGDKSGKDEAIDSETRKIDELIKAKSTQRQKDESHLALIDKLLNRNELMFLEHLIYDGHQTKFVDESNQVLTNLKAQPNWKNPVERSEQKIAGILNESKFSKFHGLSHLINEIRVDFGQNKSRDARQKMMIAERLLLTLSEYRNLTRAEIEALTTIQRISSMLDQMKHKNSKEFDVVDQLLKDLPGNVSKEWLSRQYGKGFDQLGTSSNIKLANDLVSGKLKPLLQMGAVNDFVDMTLNSSQEPQWRDEPTLNRSILPKPRQDLIVTRNPLDFAKMLWNLRPGENMFAPTLQGRQFAMGSLETRRVPNPKNPIERKVSVVYYDISGSMKGHPLETVDALLMTFADKALSEVDAIGRPTHEIYLIPFNDKIYEGIHISSREDAKNFLAKKMNMRTQAVGGTDIQKVIENFYSLISSSYQNKSGQGREKLFQKANMILFTDGGSAIDMQRIEVARKKIPSAVQINMNFVSIGDSVNETLKALSSNSKLSTTKPTFREMNSGMIDSVVGVSSNYDPAAFATEQKLSGQVLVEISEQLQKINIDPRQPGNKDQIDKAVSQIQITKADVSKLSGLREILNLQKLETVIDDMKINQVTKQRLVLAIIESYQQLSGRSWKDMTYGEKETLEKLKKWSSL
ncbi:MAG: hypothetical protein A2622_13125 [Bdellovibrionales bacterium RIFCSPHIGHO2_01_FULL_40_29]|nr:MAG: hypothetical protein A2622_13125 [Bdellovibrionales bacterium RIFCSPHIGHO2_01_FULL_40_29]